MSPVPLQIASIVVFAAAAQWLAVWLRLPSIVTLLVAGLVAGPLLGVLEPMRFVTNDVLAGIVPIAVAIILFEGGLSLRVSELRELGWVVLRLVLLGVIVTWAIAGLAAHSLLGLPPSLATLLGAILVVSGPTVVGPLMRELRPRGQVGSILRWEGIVVDPVGALLTALVFESSFAGRGHSALSSALGVMLTLVLATLTGWLGGKLVETVLRREWVPEHLHAAWTLGVVVAVFVLANSVRDESGLIVVTMMGFYLANQRQVNVDHIVRFKEDLSQILVANLFVLLAARLPRSGFIDALTPGALGFVLLLVLVARPVSVLLATAGGALGWRERAFLAGAYPRGIIAASIASLFAIEAHARGVEGGARLEAITYLVIVVLTPLYGLTLPWLGRRLGLVSDAPQGLLLLGITPASRAIAEALSRQGAEVRLLDTNFRSVVQARLAGLAAEHGNLLAADGLERNDLGGIGRMVAMTPNDDVNALACVIAGRVLGRTRVFQVAPEGRDSTRGATGAHGRVAFGPAVTLAEIERRLRAGAGLKVTPITPEFDEALFRSRHGDAALPLFRSWPNGNLDVIETDDVAASGARFALVSLLSPGDEPTSAAAERAVEREAG